MLLPREIRNMIFHELWESEAVRSLQYKGDALELHYGTVQASNQRRYSGLPTWLLACKPFLIEGRQQLQLYSSWVFEASRPQPLHDDVTWGRSIPRPWEVSKSKQMRPDTQLLDISTPRELLLQTRNPVMAPMKVFHIPSEDRPRIHRILKTLPPGPKLQVLRLSTGFKNMQRIVRPKQWRLDLAWLEQFKLRISEFEYEVKGIEQIREVGTGLEIVVAWKQMQPALAREVTRVGEVLVGGPGVLDVKVVSNRFLAAGVWGTTLAWKFTFSKIRT
jgi:hypothetical protein